MTSKPLRLRVGQNGSARGSDGPGDPIELAVAWDQMDDRDREKLRRTLPAIAQVIELAATRGRRWSR